MVGSVHEVARYTKTRGLQMLGARLPVTECCMVASNICLSTVWNFHHVILLASRILMWLLFLENVCTLAVRYTVVITI